MTVLNVNILAGNAARQWPLSGKPRSFIRCEKKNCCANEAQLLWLFPKHGVDRVEIIMRQSKIDKAGKSFSKGGFSTNTPDQSWEHKAPDFEALHERVPNSSFPTKIESDLYGVVN